MPRTRWRSQPPDPPAPACVIFAINRRWFPRLTHANAQRPDLWLRWGPGPNAGTPYYINCVGCPLTDFSLEAARDFFIAEYTNTTTAHGNVFAGMFADRAGGAPAGCRNASGYLAGHRLVFQELQARMAHATPPGSLGKYVVTNNVAYDNVSGTMLEGFRANVSQLIVHRSAAVEGRLVLVHAGYAQDGSDNHCANIANSLAAFLVSAGPGSKFGCSRGWELAQGWAHDHPDFHRPLGPPTSPASVSAAGIWRRAFSSGTNVTFDAATGIGTIEWAG